jgi:hypothetical protein
MHASRETAEAEDELDAVLHDESEREDRDARGSL